MTKPGVSAWLRRAEIALCAIGLSLLGVDRATGASSGEDSGPYVDAAAIRSMSEKARPWRAW